MAHDVFISYASEQKRVADAVCAELERNGIRCWIAPRDILPGEPFAAAIIRGIEGSSLLVLIFSQESIESPYVKSEVQEAVAENKPILTMRIQNIMPSEEMKLYLSRWHWLDAITPPLGAHLAKLVEAVRALVRLGETAPDPPPPPTPLPIVQATSAPPAEDEVALIGRERELETLARIWERARQGAAQVAVISGEAGIGKTRCARDFLAQTVRQDVYVLISQVTAGCPNGPYDALTAMLRPTVAQGAIPAIEEEFLAQVASIVPGLAARCAYLPRLANLPPDQARARLHWALMAYLLGLCARAPVILFVDDLQHTDEPSLNFLQDFLVRQPSAPLLVVTTLCSEEQPNPSHLRRWRAELRSKSQLTEIKLSPLNEAQAHRFVTAWLNIAEAPLFSRRLQTAAGGNPLYLTEILRSLCHQGILYRDEAGAMSTPFDDTTRSYEELPLPDSISNLIKVRMDSLSDEACLFLKAAAVLGQQFDPEIAQEVGELSTDQRDEAVDELTTVQLITVQDLDYRFRHNIHREVVYSALREQPGEYRKLHAQAGHVLLATVGTSPAPSEVQALAHHFFHGEVWDKALTYQMEAGLGALALYDARTARHHLERARQLLGSKMRRAPDEVRWTCLEGLGDAEALLGNFGKARKCYEQVLQRGPANTQGRIRVKTADTFYRQGKYVQAIELLDAALATLADAPEPVIASRAHLLLGMIYSRKGELEQALIEAGRALTQESALGHLLMAVVCRRTGNSEEAISQCRQAIALAEADKDVVTLAKGHTNLGVLLMDSGRLAEARHAYERGLELQTVTGDAYSRALSLCNLAEAHRFLGDLDQSMRCALVGLAEFQKQESAFGQALAHLNVGEVLLEQGEPKKARVEHLEMARLLLEQNDVADNLCDVLVAIAECRLAEGMLADAERVVSRALEVAKEEKDAGGRANALRVLGLLRQQQGNQREAETTFRQSEEACRTSGQRYDLGRTRLAQAQFYAAEPARTAEARAALDEARTIFETLGAATQLARVQALEVTA